MNSYRLLSSLLGRYSDTTTVVVARCTTTTLPRRPNQPIMVQIRKFSDGGKSTFGGRTTVTGAPVEGKQPIEIPAHTLTFTLLFIPCAMLGIYLMSYGPTEEQINEEVRSRYGTNVQVQQKNQALKEFFVNAEKGIEDQRLHQVLYGGKGEKKRFHAVDKDLYGTEQGAMVKEQVTEEIKQTVEEKKRRRKEQRRLKKQQMLANIDDSDNTTNDDMKAKSTTPSMASRISNAVASVDKETVKNVATYSLVGTAAILIGFLAGSSNSRR